MKGVSTIIATILMLVITISLSAFAYSYMTGIFTRETTVSLAVDDSSSCSGTTMIVFIDNSGTTAVNASSITISGTKADGTALIPLVSGGACATSGMINAGSMFQCTNTLTGSAGFNTVKVKEASGKTHSSVIQCTG